MFWKNALVDNLSRDLDRARDKLEARLSEEKDRRERERYELVRQMLATRT
jgi:hypothetical protein